MSSPFIDSSTVFGDDGAAADGGREMTSCKTGGVLKEMQRIYSLLSLLTLCACTVVAQGSAVSGGRAKLERQNQPYRFTSYRLANGLRVVLAPDETQKGVAVNLSFDAGSRVESPGQAGLASLLQRVVLQNLRWPQNGALGGGEILKPFEGTVNQERVSYFSELTAGQLESALALLARQMSAPDLTQASVDEQRLALLGECRQSDERRFGRAQEVLLGLIYKASAHRYGALCSLPDLNHLSLGRARAFLKTYYVPNNAVLAIVGDFRKNDAEKMVAKLFGTMSRQKTPPRAGPTGEPTSLGRRKIINHPRAGAATYVSAYLTVPSNHPDWYALNILADIIGQGDTSRLHTALVARGLAASVPEGMTETRGRSLFRVGVALLADVKVETIEAIVDAEFARLRREPVTRTELEKARAQERAYYTEQLGTPLGRASFLARSTLYYNDPNRINTELGLILAVTARDVRRVAQKYLIKTNRAVVVAQPSVSK